MCVCVCVCLVPRPEDLEEEAIQQQPKASYDSVSATQQSSEDKQPIALPDKDPISIELNEADVSEIITS